MSDVIDSVKEKTTETTGTTKTIVVETAADAAEKSETATDEIIDTIPPKE